jgi:hypothetical protein
VRLVAQQAVDAFRDVLIDKAGQIKALIIGVGGLLRHPVGKTRITKTT